MTQTPKDKRRGSFELDGRTFEVRPLTLRQLRDVTPIVPELASLPFQEQVNRSCEIIALAVSELTVEAILDMELELNELLRARNEVLRVAGFVPMGEARATTGQ